ncbi:MAG TPA: FMN-binding negative transcriptional regulator, partial [Pirellulales bacterium]
HAHGVAHAIQGRNWMLDMLNRLTDFHEKHRRVPWHVGDAPASFVDKLLRDIVGIEIPIDRLEGKLKASQDEKLQDRVGTVCGLQTETSDDARLMAELVSQAIEKDAAGRA